MNLTNNDLLALRQIFLEKKCDFRFVGGCVRDNLSGIVPNDIDLATDADPDQQEKIYLDNNIRYIATGKSHGTFTVILNDQTYEVTSLRRDVSTDGRRATVAFTRDWHEDLARRDFTINAMQMTFEGELIDPFNGQQDLANKTVRFVGDASQRIREDYLRILRWFRFAARFDSLDWLKDISVNESLMAIIHYKHGLQRISRERVWQEMHKIFAGPRVYEILQLMYRTSVLDAIDQYDNECEFHFPHLLQCEERTQNPITRLVALYGQNAVDRLSLLNCSKSEIQFAQHLYNMYMEDKGPRYYLAVKKMPLHTVIEYCHLTGRFDNFDIEMIKSWEVPLWPVSGIDAIAYGIPEGPQIKKWLDVVLEKWAKSNYELTRNELL